MLHRNISVEENKNHRHGNALAFPPAHADATLKGFAMRAGLAWRKPRRDGDVRADHSTSWTSGGRTIRRAMACGCRRLRLSDPDTYSHIALGRWILEQHTVPTTDPFSATLRGTHWVAFEWLSQTAFAIAHAIGGWTGVVALAAASVAAAFGLLTRFLLREWQTNAVLVALFAALLLVAPHILARPHVLALPVMVA